MTNYRNLTDKEIATMTVYGCTADNWKDVSVKEDFSPEFISNVHFSGTVLLGTHHKIFELVGGIKKHSGIYNCILHNCTVENDVYIDKINNYIANYLIREGSYIENVDMLVVSGLTSFGNGTRVPVLNEGGGREVPIFDDLSAPLAYILTLYRYRPALIGKLQKLIDDYALTQQSDRGTIGKNVRIVNCGSLKNIRVGDYATLEGVSLLENGSINSNIQAPVTIGTGVICNDFIVCSGTSITDSTLISRCFIGQGCIMGKHYSALDSLFFSNCQCMHGEATAVFAGPYTVSHHKSTLLIAGMFSFVNTGSGSNQSNHLYKLGPVHQGIVERGSKTASDSYLLWPARIGAFTLVLGRHTKHSDTSDLPFSYLIENAAESYLVPGANLQTVGTIRDTQKWPGRDNRKDSRKLDPINFQLLSPYTVQKMIKGRDILQNLLQASDDTSECFSYQNCKIRNSSLKKGLDLYAAGIDQFLGNSLVEQLKDRPFKTLDDLRKLLKPRMETGKGEWLDLSGLIAPKSEIDNLLLRIENDTVSLTEIQSSFEFMHKEYDSYQWTWACQWLESCWGKSRDQLSCEDLIKTVERWKAAVVKMDELLYNDSKKEFSNAVKTGFGIDGNEAEKELDFESVRGSFENNSFVLDVLNHIKEITALGNDLIERIQRITN